MDILYLLIPLAVVVLLIAIAAFVWAVKSGQFEDMEGPAHRILMDEDDPLIPTTRRNREEHAAHEPEKSSHDD